MWRLMRCGGVVEFSGGVVVEWWLSKITKVKEKRLSEDQQPDESHETLYTIGWG